VEVRVTHAAERDELWRNVVTAQKPFFARYQEKAGRLIPVAELTPLR
jgi:hypothetical protein